MPIKGVGLIREIRVLDARTFQPKTGLTSGDFVLKLTSYDGITPTEEVLSGTQVTESAPGIYRVTISASQNNHDYCVLTGVSDGNIIIPFDWDNNLGAASNSLVPVTVMVSSSGRLIAGASVYVTDDAEGVYKVVGPFTTNVNGRVNFKLAPGSYYVWRTHPAYTFAPEHITV